MPPRLGTKVPPVKPSQGEIAPPPRISTWPLPPVLLAAPVPVLPRISTLVPAPLALLGAEYAALFSKIRM